MSLTNNRLHLTLLGLISALLLILLSVRPAFALSPSLEVTCCEALEKGRTLIKECTEMALTTERCTEVLEKWDKTQTVWVITTSVGDILPPLIIVSLIVFFIWYFKKKKS